MLFMDFWLGMSHQQLIAILMGSNISIPSQNSLAQSKPFWSAARDRRFGIFFFGPP
jgi:hypothetical protein